MNKTFTHSGAVQIDRTRERPSIVHLFASFLRMGIVAFGGPAMIAYIRKTAVGEKKWLDARSFHDGVALCQMIPGATVIQMAAYIGFKIRGVSGALASYIGFGLPAFFLMMGLSIAYAGAKELPFVVSAFGGLQAIIVAVVANATLSFGRVSLREWKNALIAAIAAGLFGFMVNPLLILLLAAFLGILLKGGQSAGPGEPQSNPTARAVIPVMLFLAALAAGLAVLFFIRRELFDLAVLIARIDLIAFGGGFASLPLMFHEIVEVRSWMDSSTFLNGIALGQFTPGPIVITATFVGYMVYGLAGAIVATVAIFSPSFLILLAVAPWFDRIRSSTLVTTALNGVVCSFVGLLSAVTIRFALNVQWDFLHIGLSAAAFAALFFKVDILWVVLAGTALSIIAF